MHPDAARELEQEVIVGNAHRDAYHLSITAGAARDGANSRASRSSSMWRAWFAALAASVPAYIWVDGFAAGLALRTFMEISDVPLCWSCLLSTVSVNVIIDVSIRSVGREHSHCSQVNVASTKVLDEHSARKPDLAPRYFPLCQLLRHHANYAFETHARTDSKWRRRQTSVASLESGRKQEYTIVMWTVWRLWRSSEVGHNRICELASTENTERGCKRLGDWGVVPAEWNIKSRPANHDYTPRNTGSDITPQRFGTCPGESTR